MRFKSEAFWGMEGQIVVLTEERVTTELSFPSPVTEPMVQRLRTHLGQTDVG